MAKSRITIKKHEGDDIFSWAVFLDGKPKYTGLARGEANYYKGLVQRSLDEAKPLPSIDANDPKFKKLVSDIYRVYQDIAYDVEQCVAECGEGEPMDRESWVEACIDANHLSMIANAKDSDEYLSSLIDTHKYPIVLKTLVQHCHL